MIFFEEDKRYDSEISPKQIIGIEYAFNYNFNSNITWLELIFSLKRLDWVIYKFKNVEELLNHIHYNDEAKLVFKFGNQLFTRSGQHRLCLAKFLQINSIKVSILEYKLNKPKLVRSLKLAKYQELFKNINVHTTGNNLENIHFNISDKSVKMKFEVFEHFIKYYQAYKVYQYFQLFIAKILSPENKEYNIEIESKLDLKKLNYLIIKSKLSKKLYKIFCKKIESL